MSITLATISDAHNTVTSFSPSPVPRDFSESLFSHIRSVNKTTPPLKIAKAESSGEYDFFAMKDYDSNLVGVALPVGAIPEEKDPAEDETLHNLLKDLLFLASVSASCPKHDAAMATRIKKILTQRVNAVSEVEIAQANEAAEIMRRVAAKRTHEIDSHVTHTHDSSSSSDKHLAHHHHASSAAAASSSSSSHKNATSPARSSSKKENEGEKEQQSNGEEEQEEEGSDEHQHQRHQHQHHHHETHLFSNTSELPPETQVAWKRFQETNQYKASVAVLGLAALISLVMFLCSPDLTGCGYLVTSRKQNSTNIVGGRRRHSSTTTTSSPSISSRSSNNNNNNNNVNSPPPSSGFGL